MKINSRVLIHNTNSPELDGKIVKITGCLSKGSIVTSWIVTFDEPFDESGEITKVIMSINLKEVLNDPFSHKQVLVMRKDLNMRKGKLIAQGAHASLKVTLENMDHPDVKAWLAGAFTKIAVSVDSEEEMMEILKAAQEADIVTALITDAGKTEFNGVPTNTCIAVGPAARERVDVITRHLKLL